ncbi:MAG: winged helix-turn-helix transcriptional regulator [Clostridia bacterium]|nr:winged helix-turn-helix transcriptional regulator [Clostridia bacterium]
MENVELISLVTELKKKVDKIMDRVLKEVGLSKIQALVLISIKNKEENTNCSVNDIVNEFELNQGNTSSLLKRMEASGLIEKVRAKDDERRVELAITRKGQNMLDEIYLKMEILKKKINDSYDLKRKNILIQGMKEMDNLLEFMLEEE